MSGGGDSDLFVWDWTTGKLVQKVPVMDVVKPLLRVKGGRRNFVRLARKPDGQGVSRKSRRGKGKRGAKAKAQAGSATPDEDAEGLEEDGAPAGEADETAEDVQMEDAEKPGDPTQAPGEGHLLHKFDPSAEAFVVGKIGSTTAGDENLVLFTCVG